MKAVAAGDEIADEGLLRTVHSIADRRLLAVETFERHDLGLEEQRLACCETGRDEILRDLGLAVDHDGLAAGQGLEVDAPAAAVDADVDAAVDEALAVHAGADAHLVQEVDRALLEHAGPDAALDMRAVVPLEHDRGDAGLVQELGQQEPGRARADDADLGAHGSLPPSCGPAGRLGLGAAP